MPPPLPPCHYHHALIPQNPQVWCRSAATPNQRTSKEHITLLIVMNNMTTHIPKDKHMGSKSEQENGVKEALRNRKGKMPMGKENVDLMVLLCLQCMHIP
ncbi:hypothetical protein Droror1_Dr00012192 [Drosera rotundifolia]